MIYRGPGSVVWFGSLPTPFPPSVNKLSLFLNLRECHRSSLLMWEGGGGRGEGGRRAKPYDREKAWASINHSIFSVPRASPAFHSWLPFKSTCNLSSFL
jgi:hypothetical protein